MRIFKDIFNLFFPEVCLTCKNQLYSNESSICTFCRHDFPQTNFTNESNNLLEKLFYGRTPINEATALFYFHKKGKVQELVHQLKYRNHEEIGELLGSWLGEEIKLSNRFTSIDYIVPVPIHPNKRKKRGYNQLTKFGEALARTLSKTLIENNLIKVDSTDTQTRKGRMERWLNVQNHFELADPSFFENSHVLLIDDVVTTGATLEACSNQFLNCHNTKVSIAVMAFTE